jgi:hypothetical protein
VALLHRVGIHEPRHGLLVRADVGGGNVVRGTDKRADLAGVAAGHPLEFGGAVTAGVDADATLGAAVRHVEKGAFPRHPHREGTYLVQRDVGRVAQAALGRSAGEVVLHPVADEQFDLAVVSVKRDADRHLAARRGEHVVEAVVVPEDRDGLAQLCSCVVERARGDDG